MEAAFLASQDLQESSSLDQTESPDDQKDSGKWIIALIINCLDNRQKRNFLACVFKILSTILHKIQACICNDTGRVHKSTSIFLIQILILLINASFIIVWKKYLFFLLRK